MAEENAVLMYKGRPLMRKDNLVYYGSMADSHIVMLQVLETKKLGDMGDKVAYEQVMLAVSDFEKGNLRLSTILAAMQ